MNKPQYLRQLTMLGVPAAKEETFHIYHDESGSGVANKKERFNFMVRYLCLKANGNPRLKR